MFTRVIELVTKRGRAREVVRAIQDEGLPVMRSQLGLVDDLLLVSDTEPDRILFLSIWNSSENADRYHRRHYPKIKGLIEGWLEVEPVMKTFQVESSKGHRINRGKAA